MIGGLLVDALAVGAIFAFGWAGIQLGARASIDRLLGTTVAVLVVVVLRDPAGDVIAHLPRIGDEVANAIAVILLGVGAYASVRTALARWRAYRAVEDEYEDADSDDELVGSARSVRVAAAAGALVGAGWVLVFVGLLVLLPGDGVVTQAAGSSRIGGLLVRQESGLRWIADGFPSVTQTLPKGERGAVVGERERIELRGSVEYADHRTDTAPLLRAINDARGEEGTTELAYNGDLAAVARRHAEALARARTLSHRPPGGGSLGGRVQAALGDASGGFEERVGVEVAWAHSPANAIDALSHDEEAWDLLTDPAWSEIGIGTVDLGWFNGRIHVFVLIAPVGARDTSVDEGSGGEADTSTLSREECIEEYGVDLDGDGTKDEESLDPSLVGCADE